MNFTIKVVIAVVVLAAAVKVAPILAALFACGLALWGAFTLAARKWERDGVRRQELFATANRAEIQDAQILRGDGRGVHGIYPPAEVS